MYCVKCGVQLAEGAGRCPLCQTPVWNPDEGVAVEPTFSNRYPQPLKSRRYPILAFLTVLLIANPVRVDVVCHLDAAAVCGIFSNVLDVVVYKVERFQALLHRS